MSDQLNEYRSRLRDALGIINDLKSRISALEQARSEPIAIVGLGCRFPGGGHGPNAFWNTLVNGIDTIREIPASRWPASAIPRDRPEVRWAALLDDIEGFDAAFFGISPREAASLDPQQRLLLETAWEAVEDASLLPSRLTGSLTGVFVGLAILDYQQLIVDAGMQAVDTYSFTGNLGSTAAGRLSYFLGLQGPCETIDTACSSSLVALHQACQSLRNGECEMAIVAGVNAIVSPYTMAMLAHTNALAPDGRCKTLDARANGYVRGEGCGALIVKRLSEAKRDGNRIWGVIRGSAVNQDGRSTGLTTPNVLSQQALLRQALANARVSADQIGYVELHGTGTPLGDPIEMEALKAAIGAVRPNRMPCVLGALKTNVGHLEGAAGIAGVIKTLLALKHEIIPKNLHFRALNPRIDIENTPFVIPSEPIAWRRGTAPRFGGVSSFGISGTNAHVILEEAPLEVAVLGAKKASAYLLPLSAKSPQALSALAQSYADWFSSGTDSQLQDVVYTTSTRRLHHEHRLAIVGQTHADFSKNLAAFAQHDVATESVFTGQTTREAPSIVFVFAGQGSQWAGMGRTLLDDEPIFRAKVEEIDAIARRYTNFSLVQELIAREQQSRLNETEIAQPALFALQVGLTELFKSWGITPAAVIGHSVGEVAAAHVAGSISLEGAVRLVVLRGRVMQKATGNGKMVWVALPAEEVMRSLVGLEDALSIGAVNDPSSVVLSGKTAILDAIVADFQKRGIATRPLRVNYAFHSPQMVPLAHEFVMALGGTDAKASAITLYSTVTGARIEGGSLDSEYWGRNVYATVNFAAAACAALRDGHRTLVEIGPHPVLLANLQQCATTQNVEASIISNLRRQGNERRGMLETVGALYVEGIEPDWAKIYPEKGRCPDSLPHYPWHKERYWIEIQSTPKGRGRVDAGMLGHPLLGKRVAYSAQSGVSLWERAISAEEPSWMSQHIVRGRVIFPGAGYVEMAISAAKEILGDKPFVLENFIFLQVLICDPGLTRIVQTVLMPKERHQLSCSIASRPVDDDTWTLHATCTIEDDDIGTSCEVRAPDPEFEPAGIETGSKEHYDGIKSRNLDIGPAFHGVERTWYDGNYFRGHVVQTEQVAAEFDAYQVHPAWLDAIFQPCLRVLDAIENAHEKSQSRRTFVPSGIDRVRLLHRPSSDSWVVGHSSKKQIENAQILTFDLDVADAKSNISLELRGLTIHQLDDENIGSSSSLDDCVFELSWKRQALQTRKSEGPIAPGTSTRPWLIFADEAGIGSTLGQVLARYGHSIILVEIGTSFARITDRHYRLNPANKSDYVQLLDAVSAGGRKLGGIVHLWSVDTPGPETGATTSVLRGQTRCCISALHLFNAVLGTGWRDTPRTWLVTRGAQSIEMPADTPISITQAPLWGFGRTVALEHPLLNCSMVDLPVHVALETISEALALLLADDNRENLVVIRNNEQLLPRLVRSRFGAAAAQPFDIFKDASYLLTGGLGGLGLSVARWMIERGARDIVLVGRSQISNDAALAIGEMQSAGARIHVLQADISRADDVTTICSHIATTLPPLRGIIHLAGVIRDATISALTVEQFEEVFSPKLVGALNLHQATRDLALDFFVMYSSAASLMGSPGQANYAAANAFLDALADERVRMGLPGTSIQWGPFRDVGMAAKRANRGARLAHGGLETLSPEQGTDALERVLRRPRSTIGVLRLQPRKWLEQYPQAAALPLFAILGEEQSTTPIKSSTGFRVRKEIMYAPTESRLALLDKHIVEHVSQILRTSADRIEQSIPFAALGMDSLTGLELRNRLEISLGLQLPSTLTFTYTTVASLGRHLLGELQFVEPAAVETPHSTSTITAGSHIALAASDDFLAAFDDAMREIDED